MKSIEERAREVCPNWQHPEGDAHYRDVKSAMAAAVFDKDAEWQQRHDAAIQVDVKTNQALRAELVRAEKRLCVEDEKRRMSEELAAANGAEFANLKERFDIAVAAHVKTEKRLCVELEETRAFLALSETVRARLAAEHPSSPTTGR